MTSLAKMDAIGRIRTVLHANFLSLWSMWNAESEENGREGNEKINLYHPVY